MLRHASERLPAAGVGRTNRLEGVSALVTGASGGIGRAVCERFLAEGASVFAVDVEEPRWSHAGARAVVADVTQAAEMDTAVQTAADACGRLDVCVANAGIALHQTLMDGTPEEWLSVLRVNLLGVMVTFRAAAARMIADGGGGRLLATSSTAGLRGESESGAYCASKGGVNALVQSLACELAQHRITVNAVAPGEIQTDLQRRGVTRRAQVLGRSPEELYEELVTRAIPAGRLGTPHDVAGMFAFLASPDADYVTGTVLRVDGGQLLV